MEAGESVPHCNGKELRMQRFAEYLAAKERLKLSNQKPHLRDPIKAKTTTMSKGKANLENGKENLTTGKEIRNPNILKKRKQTTANEVMVKSVLGVTTNKQDSTTRGTVVPLPNASNTTRLNTLKELRMQKLAEYLAAKERLKLPNPKPYLRDPIKAKTTTMSKGKANLDNAKEGENILKTKKQTTMIHPAANKAPVKRNLCGTTNKTGSTLSAASYKTRLSEAPLKGVSKTLVKSLPTVSARRNSVSMKTCPVQNSQTGLQPNPTVKNSYSLPVGRLQASVAGPLPNTVSKVQTGKVAPKMTQSRSTIPAPTASTCYRTRLSTAHPVPAVTQRLAGSQRKTNSFTTVSKTSQRTGALSVQDKQKGSTFSSRTYSKTLPGTTGKPAGLKQPVARSEPSRQGLTGTGSKTIGMKPVGKGEPSLKTKTKVGVLVGEVKPEARAAGAPTVRSLKPAHRASVGLPGSHWQAKALSRAMYEAVAKMRPNVSGEDNVEDIGETATNIRAPTPLCLSNSRVVHATCIPQTMPRSASKTCHSQVEEVTWEAGVGLRSPRDQARVMPQTDRKKMTAAQEDRIQKLQEWRESKGISYKRPPMPVKPLKARRTMVPCQPYWASMEDEDIEAKSLVCALDKCLADCIKLLDEGCPSAEVHEMLSKVPMAEKFSKFWICQARLMEREGVLDVLPLFEEAVRVVLEPVDDLRTVVFEMLKKKEEQQGQSPVALEDEDDRLQPDSEPEPVATPTAVKALIRGELRGSSVVKYKITNTPGGFRSQQKERGVPRMVDGQELRFFTPVRRSVRIEETALRYPASLQEHDVCVASFNHLMSQEEEEETLEEEQENKCDHEGAESAAPAQNGLLYVYRENEALRDQVNIQLVYAEED